jgi:hypothetical protein
LVLAITLIVANADAGEIRSLAARPAAQPAPRQPAPHGAPRLAERAPVGALTFDDSVRVILGGASPPTGPGARLRAGAAPGDPTTCDPAALRAVIHLLAAYSSMNLPAFERLLTADFRFHSGGTPGEPSFVLTREDEIESLRRLLEGSVRPSGERLPAARRIVFSAGPFRIRPDPDQQDPQGRYMLVLALDVGFEIEFEDGSIARTDTVSQLFHLARVDAASLAAGVRPTEGEWFVREWTEGPPPVAARRAPPRPASRSADTASTRMDSAVVAGLPLAIALLENPARGVIVLSLSLPGPGQARIEAFDLAGRRVMSREIAAEGGTRRMTLEPGHAMHAGVYWLRLSQGRHQATSRFVLIE